MSVVWLGPVEPIVLRPTTVRAAYRWFPDSPTERLVPPVVPSFDEPCPDCGGDGRRNLELHDMVGDPCLSCEGTGTVERLWLAEEQCRGSNPDDREWRAHCGVSSRISEAWHERRLAVVAWYEPTVLPVYADNPKTYDTAKSPFLIVTEGIDGGWLWHDRDTDDFGWTWVDGFTAEPGCVVVMFGDEHRLDTPITRMAAQWGDDKPWKEVLNGTVPLSLSPGLNDVELA